MTERQAAKDKKTELQAAEIKAEEARNARKLKPPSEMSRPPLRTGARPKKLRRQQQPTPPSAGGGVLRPEQRRRLFYLSLFLKTAIEYHTYAFRVQ